MAFFRGQRWVSNTEPELGLGIVLESASRQVVISFPAASDQRTYMAESAPLHRVIYPVGETIRRADGQPLTILEYTEEQGCILYRGTAAQGDLTICHERDLDSFVRFSKPQHRLFAGQVDKNSSFQLRQETLLHRHRHQQSPAFGLLGPRVQLLPHQFYIAHQVGQRHAPRVLLADEVGLGKTIEAGLIMHQQLISGRASRVMIVVPDSLVYQWLVEMLRRFNLHFTILDEARCNDSEVTFAPTEDEDEDDNEQSTSDFDGDEKENPFESAQLILCSLAFLTANSQRHQQALAADWDLLVVDEAHHLHWHEGEASPEYICIEALAQKASGLLLLTATPEQLGLEGHFARLRLLDPARYYDLQHFKQEEANYQPVSRLVQQLKAEDLESRFKTQPEIRQQLQAYLGSDGPQLLERALLDGNAAHAVEQLTERLLDRHGTGRVLFRNTREAVTGFPERQLFLYPLAAPQAYSRIAEQADPEDCLKPELLLGESWLQQDPRVAWLVDWLADHRNDKVLLICAHAGTAKTLEEYLRLRQGIRSAVFHEGLSLVARDRAAAYFAEDHDSAQILICSEIGSEGRNFQFAHHLILFDLPLNPDLLEQRIGRLDRIGQKNSVHIHLPVYADSPQQRLARWYHEGLNAFEKVCPVGQTIFEQFRPQLMQCLRNEADFEILLQHTRAASDELRQELHNGRDRLLEMNSCQPAKAGMIVAAVSDATHALELADYMDRVFDHYGVEQEPHSLDSIVLRPGDHMLCHNFPGLSEDGVTGTYQRVKALAREDMEFITWEHPMVTGAMDTILSGNFGNTALCTIKLPPLKPGTIILEALFVLHCPAPPDLQIHRYLDEPVIRLVTDDQNHELSGILSFAKLNQLVAEVPRGTSSEVLQHIKTTIGDLVIHAQERVKEQAQNRIDTVIAKLESHFSNELNRLAALTLVNPNVRSEEILQLQSTYDRAADCLRTASFELDALRVVVIV